MVFTAQIIGSKQPILHKVCIFGWTEAIKRKTPVVDERAVSSEII